MIIFEKAVEGSSPLGLVRFARRAQKLVGVSGEVNILVAGNRRIRSLNLRFRKKNKTTDVLSFSGNGCGDIAISADIAKQNARRYRHPASSEMKILILHGLLHLAGHDHETDNGRMAELERKLRVELKLPGALIERTHARVPGKPAARRRLR